MSLVKPPIVVFCLVAGLAVGCGGSSAAPDGGALNCPGAPPAATSACTGSGSCFYEDCAGAGRTVAACNGGAWTVETGACAPFVCRDNSCQAGQICVERIGGALLVSCVANTCDTAAIGCGCLQSCSGTCWVTGTVESGIHVMCNTCTSTICA